MALKRNEIQSHEKTCRKCKCMLLCESSQFERTTYYMFPTIHQSGKGKTTESVKKISGYQVFGWREEWIGLAQKILRSLKLFCMILQLWTHIYFVYFSKTIKWVPRVNSNANYELWVMRMYSATVTHVPLGCRM